MKIPIQQKIAELERRIIALEAQRSTGTQTVSTKNLEPEWSGLWKKFDELMAKAFPKRSGL